MIRTFVTGLFFWFALTGLFTLPAFIAGIWVLGFLFFLIRPRIDLVREMAFLIRVFMLLPEAYRQGFVLLMGRNNRERWTIHQVFPVGSWRLFTETFLVTLTPETLVTRINGRRDLVVHDVEVHE